MALTREYKQTVLARIKRDPKFARALHAEAVNARLEGETDEGLSMLREARVRDEGKPRLTHAEVKKR